MSLIPTDPNQRLTRKQTAQALTESGYPIKDATLATMASRGGGPEYQMFGTRVLYRWGDVLAWAQSRLSAPRRNTSEGDAIGQATRAKSEPRSGKATTRRRPRQRNRAEAEATT